MERFAPLRATLLSTLKTQTTSQNDLFNELNAHLSHIRKLYKIGKRNPQEQRELESGKMTIHGRSITINPGFARQAIFLSQQLECPERYTATLLHEIMEEDPNISPSEALKAVVLEFHQRRRDLAESLRYILEAAQTVEYDKDAPPICKTINDFVRRHLGGKEKDPHAFPNALFVQITWVSEELDKARLAKQNAISETVPATEQGRAPALGDDIFAARCDSLKSELRSLAAAWCILARMGCWAELELHIAITKLSTDPNHSAAYYFLTAVLAAFEPPRPGTPAAEAKTRLTEKEPAGALSRLLGTALQWKDPSIKAAILLAWTLFLADMKLNNPAVGTGPDEVELSLWNAIQGDAFTCFTRFAIRLQKKRAGSSPSLFAARGGFALELDQEWEVPTDDFRLVVLRVFESVMRLFIIHGAHVLRKIKQRQEDIISANSRSTLHASSSNHVNQAGPGQPGARNDTAMFYTLVGLIYSALPPDSALQFWGSTPLETRNMTFLEQREAGRPKLPTFLQWAVWTTQIEDSNTAMALWDLLAGIAKGQLCSELAFNFLARGGQEIVPGGISSGDSFYHAGPMASWAGMFNILGTWHDKICAPPPAPPQPPAGVRFSPLSAQAPSQPEEPEPFTLTMQDVLLVQSFLRFLTVCITHSVEVRKAIAGNPQLQAIPILVSLIPLSIPLELKGALFDSLSAFAEPGAGVAGVEMCRAIWTLMEDMEVINVRTEANKGGRPPVKGVEVELEEVESVYRLYPATIPFLRLLATLIHTPKRIPIRDSVSDVDTTITIPPNLGEPYRTPGIRPYVAFVIDDVFTKISSREFLKFSDRWQMNDLCLCFIERCLASYELESLLFVSTNGTSIPREAVTPFLVHPGYEVMERLLTHSSLQQSILSYLLEGAEGFDRGLGEQEPFFVSTMVRVLRIVHRVLEIQDIYVDLLVPLIPDFAPSWMKVINRPRSHFTKLDQALSFKAEYAPAVAVYIAFPAYPELPLLSVKVLDVLSSSKAFTDLTIVIERCGDSERILTGYVQIMAAETMEDVFQAQIAADKVIGAGAPDMEEPPEWLLQATRMAVLDFFIKNTQPGRPYPNLAHFLLLGSASRTQQIQDPHALNARRTSIHTIIDLLMAGVPKLKEKRKGRDLDPRLAVQSKPLFQALPGLAEPCYHLVYQICTHPRTSDFMMRYLRTREDFFARQLAVVTFEIPSVDDKPYVEISYSDNVRITTTVSVLNAFLRLRSWILDLAALELHVLTNTEHHKGVSDLLQILFGNQQAQSDNGSNGSWLEGRLQPFYGVGQSNLRMVELLQSLNFDWLDSLTVQQVELRLLSDLDLNSCLRVDDSGCAFVDKIALVSLLAKAKRDLNVEGRLVTSATVDQLNAETAYILDSCDVENHRRKIHHAISTSYEAWRRLLDITLMKCFGRLPQNRREDMLFDLLHVLPSTVRSFNVEEPTAVLLSEAVLSCITKLREERRRQTILQSVGGDVEAGILPAERLFSLLRDVLECIADTNRGEVVRGNLYAVLINYFRLVATADGSSPTSSTVRFSSSLSASLVKDGSMLGRSQWSIAVPAELKGGSRDPVLSLQLGSLSILKNIMDGLIGVVARDTMDGPEVWKTVGFTLLDSLAKLSRLEKAHSATLTLARSGALVNFAHELKEMDRSLRSVLKPDPDDLNSLYVYETMMSLFIRLAHTKQGAERLLETRLLRTLAQCDYIDASPEGDEAFINQDSFLPSAVERYHQVFMPAFQLVRAILATLGSQHAIASKQALDFLMSHKETILIMLKSRPTHVYVSLLEETDLVISLCSSVLPLMPQIEFAATASGFGGVHAAILNRTAEYIVAGSWTKRVIPQTEMESREAQVSAPGYESASKFDVSVRKVERSMRKSMIEYLGVVSGFAETEFNPVLSSVTTAPGREERHSRFHPAIPNMGDAIEALSEICMDLSDTLRQMTSLAAELANKEHIRIDDIQEIIDVPDVDFLEDIDLGQKRSLICRQLETSLSDTKERADSLLTTLEMLLLLLWRHLIHYIEGHESKNSTLPPSLARSRRSYDTPDTPTFRTEVNKKLGPLLQRVSTLSKDLADLATNASLESAVNEWRASQAYVTTMIERLRDAVESSEAMHAPLFESHF